jgi:hypothetical protein
MARTTLSAQTAVRSGLTPTSTAGIADGHKFANDGATALRVTNSHATLARDVTIQTQRTVDGQAAGDRTVSVPALSTRYVGPFPRADFNVASGADKGMAYIDYDSGNESELAVEIVKMS